MTEGLGLEPPRAHREGDQHVLLGYEAVLVLIDGPERPLVDGLAVAELVERDQAVAVPVLGIEVHLHLKQPKQ